MKWMSSGAVKQKILRAVAILLFELVVCFYVLFG